MNNENIDENNFIDIKNKVEAILFSYGEWISIREISQILKIDSTLLIKNALNELIEKFREGFSFYIQNEDEKYRMVLKSEYVNLVEELVSEIEIPKKVLKVLAVIAYEGPVSKTRLSEILGKSVKEEVDFLYKNKFISYEKKGIGRFYKITKKFYEYFNIDENENLREKIGPINKYITEYIDDENNDNEKSQLEEESEKK